MVGKRGKQKTETASLKECREALARAVTQEEMEALWRHLMELATSEDNNAVSVRAAELLLRYRFGPANQPPAEEQEVEQVKIIQVHTPMPERSEKRKAER